MKSTIEAKNPVRSSFATEQAGIQVKVKEASRLTWIEATGAYSKGTNTLLPR